MSLVAVATQVRTTVMSVNTDRRKIKMKELKKRSQVCWPYKISWKQSHISNSMIYIHTHTHTHTHTRRYRIFPEQNKEHRFKSTNTLGLVWDVHRKLMQRIIPSARRVLHLIYILPPIRWFKTGCKWPTFHTHRIAKAFTRNWPLQIQLSKSDVPNCRLSEHLNLNQGPASLYFNWPTIYRVSHRFSERKKIRDKVCQYKTVDSWNARCALGHETHSRCTQWV